MAIDPKKIQKALQVGKQQTSNDSELYKEPSSSWEQKINAAKNYTPSVNDTAGGVPILNPDDYDFQIKTNIDNRLYRAQRQSGWKQAGNALLGDRKSTRLNSSHYS